jgi:hypothetical protein
LNAGRPQFGPRYSIAGAYVIEREGGRRPHQDQRTRCGADQTTRRHRIVVRSPEGSSRPTICRCCLAIRQPSTRCIERRPREVAALARPSGRRRQRGRDDAETVGESVDRQAFRSAANGLLTGESAPESSPRFVLLEQPVNARFEALRAIPFDGRGATAGRICALTTALKAAGAAEFQSLVRTCR